MLARKKGLLIICNYNQQEELPRVLDKLQKHPPAEDILIVDDGSTDDSIAIIQSKGFRYIQHSRNLGVGATLRTGFQYAKNAGIYDYVVLMASNGKMKPEEISVVTEPIKSGKVDYVQGSRYLNGFRSPGLSSFRRLAIPALTCFVNILTGRKFTDVTCGFRAYTLELLQDPHLNLDQEWLNRYEMEMYIHFWVCQLKKYRVIETPVTMDYSHLDKKRRSKIRPFVDWWSMCRPWILLKLGFRR